MSHVSALPSSSPSLDQSAVEAAQYALKAFSFAEIESVDVMDAAVVVVGAAAVARMVYLAAKHPSSVEWLQKVVALLKSIRN